MNTTQERFVYYYKKYRGSPLRVLLGFYRGSYHKFLISAFFYLIKHSPTLFSPLLIAGVINGVLEGGDAARHAILLNTGIWLGLLSIHLPANYLHSMYRSRVIRSTEAGLREAMVRKLQELSIPYHTQIQSGRLQSKIIRDVEAIETLSTQMFVNLLNIVMNLTIMITITAVKNRIILVFFVLVAPVASLTVVAFRRRISRVNRAFRLEMEETSARVMEMVEMIPVTRAHALEEVEKERMSHQLQETAEKGYRLDMVQSNFGAAGWVVFQCFQALCLGFSGFMAFRGLILVGDITFYQTSFTTVVNQFTALINLLPIMTKGLESVTSVGEVLSSDDVEENEGKTELAELRGAFSFRHLAYRYPGSEKRVLEDFCLDVRPGQTIAVVGESGAGKSTLMNLLVGFMMPESGQILIDGQDIRTINLKTYRRFLSVVPQTPLLFTGSLRDNITYGMDHVSEEKLEEALEAANLKKLVDQLPQGADTLLEEHGANLSGGQRQRIAIARALIRDPKVILLDEATSALDVVSELEIQKALERLVKDRTTFIVAHRLSTIRNADWIVVMEQGKIAEAGTYEDLLSRRGIFYHMESLQMSLR
ncbi:MAG: ABC transporter ATP-binding protein [Lachnospiraceae bacterium]|nr:ABC transporter ATP-binding protein [Lachnospiraceae bacterium]MBQ5360870.1 ABC transporter ATP-binding protein [Lachnospiraceae bacterium]